MTRLASAFAGLKDSQACERLDVQEPARPQLLGAQKSGRLDVQPSQTPERPALPLQGTAKRSHPDFGKRTIYVRDRTHRLALRKFEDGGGREFSDLVETLLQEYLAR